MRNKQSTFHAHLLFLVFSACAADEKREPTTADTGAADAGSTRQDGSVDSRMDAETTLGDASSDAAQAMPDAATDPTSASLACPALPAATGTVVNVGPGQAGDLPSIVASATSGTTILLADGTYKMPAGNESARRIQMKVPQVTIRSASGNASAVILDGEYGTNEMITIHADDITLANFTIQRAVDHPVHITPDQSGEIVRRTRLYGMRLVDGGEQFIKVNPNGENNGFADDGVVECSHFELTNEGRPHIETVATGCYTGGIDAHAARGWVIRNNRFLNLYCTSGLAEHAVHFWSASRDTLVENNTILGCARGIGFGLVEDGRTRAYADNPYSNVSTYIGHYDGMIRNNVIWADHAYFDTGIELIQARGTRVHHNTIAIGQGATGFYSGIDYRFASTSVQIRNNIAPRITFRNNAAGTVESNLMSSSLALFVNAAQSDFHLAASANAAIDKGVATAAAGADMDGQTHDRGAPDIGADER
jgi:hypothetical protein